MNTRTVSALRSLPRLRARGAALALVLGVAGAAGLVTAQPAPPPPAASAAMPGGPMHMHGHGHRHGGPMGGRFMEGMLERVNASAEQRTKIRAIFEAAGKDMRAQADTRRQLHEQGLALLAQPTIDANAVEGLRQQMLAQHDQASQRWSKAMVEAANVLTPQQRAQLAEAMRQRAAEHGHGHGPRR